jgi:hypothetical protein
MGWNGASVNSHRLAMGAVVGPHARRPGHRAGSTACRDVITNASGDRPRARLIECHERSPAADSCSGVRRSDRVRRSPHRPRAEPDRQRSHPPADPTRHVARQLRRHPRGALAARWTRARQRRRPAPARRPRLLASQRACHARLHVGRHGQPRTAADAADPLPRRFLDLRRCGQPFARGHRTGRIGGPSDVGAERPDVFVFVGTAGAWTIADACSIAVSRCGRGRSRSR